MKKLLVFSALLSFSAFADQCAWNTRTDVKSAVKLVKNNDVIFWCQNCGEKKPSKIFKVIDYKVSTVRYQGLPEGRILTVNVGSRNEELDLAYTYVRTASDIFTNVAHLVGCPSAGATSFIQTGPGVRKVAHYYDARGVRINTANSDVEGLTSYMSPEHVRVPASK